MLRPFAKGDPRINRQGRPKKGTALTEILEKALSKKRNDGRTNKAALADTLIALAIEEKNIAAIKYIMDRVDGRPKESIALESGAIETKLMEVFNNG